MSLHLGLQKQIYLLMIGGLAVALLVSYRSEVSDANQRDAAYALCQARQAQAQEVNDTRENIGHLILALVPDADPEARAAMLAGMTSTQRVHIEDCDIWLR